MYPSPQSSSHRAATTPITLAAALGVAGTEPVRVPSTAWRNARTSPSHVASSACGLHERAGPAVARIAPNRGVASPNLEAALATLDSAPRNGERPRKRACTSSGAYTLVSSSSTTAAVYSPGAPAGWGGPGFPSVLLSPVAGADSCPPYPPAPRTSSPVASTESSPISLSTVHSRMNGDSRAPYVKASSPGTPNRSVVVDWPTHRQRKKPVKKPVGHIQRPPNSFFLYRSARHKEVTAALDESGVARPSQADLSRQIAAMWKAESPEVRDEYARQAAEQKAAHAQRYPDYAFRPKPRASPRQSAKGPSARSTDSPQSPPVHSLLVSSSRKQAAPIGLVGTDSAGQLSLWPMPDFSLPTPLPSPCSISSGDIPVTPPVPTGGTHESYFLPLPSPAASEAWTTFCSAPLASADLPDGPSSTSTSYQSPSTESFLPCPWSAPVDETGLDFALAPLPSGAPSYASYPHLPRTTHCWKMVPTYEDLLTAMPAADLVASPPSAPSSSSFTLPCTASEGTTLHSAAEPQPSGLACPLEEAPWWSALEEDRGAVSQTFYQPFASHYPSPE